MITTILEVIGIFVILVLFITFLMFISDWFVCKYKKLHLYGYYTNGIGVFQLIQYDKIQATLYDVQADRAIMMGRSEFIRDFEFIMSDTVKLKECVQGV